MPSSVPFVQFGNVRGKERVTPQLAARPSGYRCSHLALGLVLPNDNVAPCRIDEPVDFLSPLRNMLRFFAALLILASSSGCSTAGTLSSGSEDCYLYSGTRQDVRFIRGRVRDCTGHLGIVGCLDLPWSFLLYTALVPVTAPLQVILGSPKGMDVSPCGLQAAGVDVFGRINRTPVRGGLSEEPV
jgi:uncharacterized protein YceK